MISVNGILIPTPKSFEATVSDLDGESNRNLFGDLMRSRIAVKRKLNLEWASLTQHEMQVLLTAVSGTFFTVTYPDPQEGLITKTMYVGDRTAAAYQYINGEVKWSGLKMNFIEK